MPDTTRELRVAVDVGNTRTHLAVIDIENLRCLYRTDIQSAAIQENFADALAGLTQNLPNTVWPLVTNVACGINGAYDAVKVFIQDAGVKEIRRVMHHDELPVRFEYGEPARLGADRIADCLYARAVSGPEDLIVIDAGTAITINVVRSSGVFVGGAILPGIGLQFSSLHHGTAALPLIESTAKPLALGGSTRECIAAGVLYGIAGALERLVSEYTNKFSTDFNVLATGGGWNVISTLVGFAFSSVPDCTLIGTALFEPQAKNW